MSLYVRVVPDAGAAPCLTSTRCQPVGDHVDVAEAGVDDGIGADEVAAAGEQRLGLAEEVDLVGRAVAVGDRRRGVGVQDPVQVGVLAAQLVGRVAVGDAPVGAVELVLDGLVLVADQVDADVALRRQQPLHDVAGLVADHRALVDRAAAWPGPGRRCRVCRRTSAPTRPWPAPPRSSRRSRRPWRMISSYSRSTWRLKSLRSPATRGSACAGVVVGVRDQQRAIEQVRLALHVLVEARGAERRVDRDLTDAQVPPLAHPAVAAARAVLHDELGRDAMPRRNLELVGQVHRPVTVRHRGVDDRQPLLRVGVLQPVDRRRTEILRSQAD